MPVVKGKLSRAFALLELLTWGLEGDEETYYVECYQNCREQGFTVSNLGIGSKRKAVTFSENRNSDAIVVYKDNFAFSSISEESYKTAKYFSYNEHDRAVDYMVEYLRSEDEEEIENED